MTKTLYVFGCLAVLCSGCISQQSYRRIPSKYTTLRWSPDNESYLIEITPAFVEPIAKRFDFIVTEEAVTLKIQSFTRDRASSVIQISGEPASRLLAEFRGFNWSAIEDPVPEDIVILTPDETEVVLKAQTLHSYRELSIGVSRCAALRHLLKTALNIEKEPNKALVPTPASVTPAADAPVAPAAAAAQL